MLKNNKADGAAVSTTPGVKKLRKKRRSVETLKSRYGMMFVLPWVIGLVLFFFVPLFESITYVFSEVSLTANGIQKIPAGFKWFRYLFVEAPGYQEVLQSSIAYVMARWPLVVILSLILAVVLNQKFKGRLIARAIFFLPVIIASGAVITLLTSESIGLSLMAGGGGTGNDTYGTMIDFDAILGNLGLPEDITKLMESLLGSIFGLVWDCGVQIVLFIAGLQTIPDQLYEVSRVEGASKWEEFWYITVPMLGQTIFLVMVYTMIEFIANKSGLASWAFNIMSEQQIYDRTSAMLWIYFAICGAIMALVVVIYNRLCLKKWS